MEKIEIEPSLFVLEVGSALSESRRMFKIQLHDDLESSKKRLMRFDRAFVLAYAWDLEHKIRSISTSYGTNLADYSRGCILILVLSW